MIKQWRRIQAWLFPAFVILFILEMLTLPLVLRLTFAGKSEEPNNVLTYTTGKLTWSAGGKNIGQNGEELYLFSQDYTNVKAKDGANLIAPGTEGSNCTQLRNEVNRSIHYIATLYRVDSSEQIPIQVTFDSEGATETDAYVLPDNVKPTAVVKAMEGNLAGKMMQDFAVSWSWSFEGDDRLDTSLGNQNDLDDVTVGLYVVVTDEGSGDDESHPGEDSTPQPSEVDPQDPSETRRPQTTKASDTDEPDRNPSDVIRPDAPDTGDRIPVLYFGLMAVSVTILIFMFLTRKKTEGEEDNG